MQFEWKDSNGQSYLHIEADTFFELGLAEGKGMVKQIMTSAMMGKFLPKLLDTSIEDIYAKAREYLPYIPQKYLDELHGIAQGVSEASGQKFTFEDVLIQALMLELMYGQYNLDLSSVDLKAFQACTCFGAVNQDGSVVMGQNYDAMPGSEQTMAWVLHKVADEPWVFSARLGASPGMPVGKNEHGLAMVVNVIMANITAPVMTPRFVRAREAFAGCKTANDAYNVMYEGGQFPFCLNMLISDEEKIIGTQIMPQEIRSNYVKDVLVQANKYDYVDWQKYLRDPQYSIERYDHASKTIREAYSLPDGIDNDALLAILQDSPIICRDDPSDRSATVAFMTRKSFGLGNPLGSIGNIPI